MIETLIVLFPNVWWSVANTRWFELPIICPWRSNLSGVNLSSRIGTDLLRASKLRGVSTLKENMPFISQEPRFLFLDILLFCFLLCMKCLFRFSYSGNFHEALNDATAAVKLEPTSIKALETGKILHSIYNLLQWKVILSNSVDSKFSGIIDGTDRDRDSSISSIFSA